MEKHHTDPCVQYTLFTCMHTQKLAVSFLARGSDVAFFCFFLLTALLSSCKRQWSGLFLLLTAHGLASLSTRLIWCTSAWGIWCCSCLYPKQSPSAFCATQAVYPDKDALCCSPCAWHCRLQYFATPAGWCLADGWWRAL